MDWHISTLDESNISPFLPLIPPEYQGPGNFYAGATIDGVPGGFAVVYWTEEPSDLVLELCDIHVSLPFRRQGVGRCLLAFVKKQAKAESFTSIEAFYETDDLVEHDGLSNFFASCGFAYQGLDKRVVSFQVADLLPLPNISSLPDTMAIVPFSTLQDGQMEEFHSAFAHVEGLTDFYNAWDLDMTFLLQVEGTPLAFVAAASHDDSILFLALHTLEPYPLGTLSLLHTLCNAAAKKSTMLSFLITDEDTLELVMTIAKDCDGEVTNYCISACDL